jgi:hypothetical protein
LSFPVLKKSSPVCMKVLGPHIMPEQAAIKGACCIDRVETPDAPKEDQLESNSVYSNSRICAGKYMDTGTGVVFISRGD